MRHPIMQAMIALAAIIAIASCHSVPDNARYIPANAVAAAGINLGSLSRKVAWEVITGSRLFKEIQRRMPGKTEADAMGGIENAGFEVDNTFYVYTLADNRFAGSSVFVGIIPLDDERLLEAYLSHAFPGTKPQNRANRRELYVGNDLRLAWNNRILMVISARQYDADADTDPVADSIAHDAAIRQHVDDAFVVPESNSITQNKRFNKFAAQDHDVSIWLNYGNFLNDITQGIIEMKGVSISSANWKDAVLTCGVNFKKGLISADVDYYLPAHILAGTKNFKTADVPVEMLHRLPKKNVGVLLSMHLSPGGVKTLLEQAGLFGPANVGLTTQGLDVDYVLEAFDGDMAVLLNDLELKAVLEQDEFMGELVEHKRQTADMNMMWCVGIKNKEHFDKLLEKAVINGMRKTENGYIMPIAYRDSVHLLVVDNYAVISTSKGYVRGFLEGKYKKDELNDAMAEKSYASPFCLFLDVKELFSKVEPSVATSPKDSALIAESKKLLNYISFSGGKLKDYAFHFELEVNFKDKTENSILELVDFAMRMNDISNAAYHKTASP